jgi:hypothetical protein
LNRLLSWVAGITLVATVVIGMSAHARAERRVALVVGNATYNAASPFAPLGQVGRRRKIGWPKGGEGCDGAQHRGQHCG